MSPSSSPSVILKKVFNFFSKTSPAKLPEEETHGGMNGLSPEDEEAAKPKFMNINLPLVQPSVDPATMLPDNKNKKEVEESQRLHAGVERINLLMSRCVRAIDGLKLGRG